VIIDCDTCRVRDVACPDCVVTALLGQPSTSVDFDEEEHKAVGALAEQGLVPPLRLVPVVGVTHRETA
jgi:hypothetical protein